MNDGVHVSPLRILIIDDNQAIHDDFRKIFGTSRERPTPSVAELALFGGNSAFTGARDFQIDSAYQGQEGLSLVVGAQKQKSPYALAFVDVRMPPGWDGIETTARIWQHDADIQIVICTAYSDYSWGEMLAKLGRSDRLVILKKPFDTIEVVQLASALTEKWRLAQQSRSIMEDLEHRVADRTRELVAAGERLQASETQYRLLFDSNPHPMWVYDTETLRFVTVNGAAVEHYGYSEQQFAAMTLLDIEDTNSVRTQETRRDEPRKQGKTSAMLRHRKHDGSLIDVEISSDGIVFDGRPARLVLSHDVTQRNEADSKIERLNRVYAVLSGIDSLIVRVRDRHVLFEEACRIAVEQGNFGMAWIGTLDAEAQLVSPVAWAGACSDELSRDKASTRDDPPHGQGTIGRAIREGRVVVENDITAHCSVRPRLLKILAAGFRSQVTLPLFEGARAMATLTLYASEPNFFDPEELRLLTGLAGNISFAIENLSTQQKVQKLSRIRAVSSGINAAIMRVRDPQELLRATCNIAVEQAGFPLAWIGMLDSDGEHLKLAAMAGTVPEYGRLLAPSIRADVPTGHGTNGRAFREKKPIVDNDIGANPSMGARQAEGLTLGIHAAMSLPLLIEGAPVGVLGLYARETGYFDDEEISLLTEVAENVSFALENISRQQKVDKLSRIRAVSSQINAAIVRIHERGLLLEQTCRIVREHGKFEMIWIGAIDHDAQTVVPIAWTGFSEQSARSVSWTSIKTAGGTMGDVVRNCKPAVRSDIESGMRAGKLREEALRNGYRSTVCLPLMVGDVVVALIMLFAQGHGFFDEEELALLSEVGADVSFALQAIEKQKKLDYLSYYDVLTGLANRSLFLERVSQYVRTAAARTHKLALYLVDLERFKNINDSLGQAAGDALLKQVAEWLTRTVGDANLLARVDADHFAVVMPQVKHDRGVARLLDKQLAAFLDHPFRLNESVFRIAAKVGVALFPHDGDDAEALFKNAEAALKKAKASGERYLFYTQQMTEAVAGKLSLENQLRHALDNEEFVIHYQPKVNLASGLITSAEALIRWNDPRTGLVPPGRFIPVLEETGLIYEVGRWALRQAIADYLRWRDAQLTAVRIAVNVSPLQLRNRGFIAEVQQVIGVDAHAVAGLELEITESLIMEDVKHNIATLQAIRAMGVTVAIDDFGTGFSSLSYLSKLPVDTLKIDRSFVIDMTAAPEGLALVSTIINLAHSLKLKVVAEGVETADQSRLLRLLSCDEMQGFLFSKAVPREVFESRFLAPRSAGAPQLHDRWAADPTLVHEA